MPLPISKSSRLLLTLSLPFALCLNALPARATTVQEHLDAGYAFADQAMKYEQDHKFRTACRYYKYARDELAGAILGTISSRQSLDAEGVQNQVNAIMKHMEEICRLDDE